MPLTHAAVAAASEALEVSRDAAAVFALAEIVLLDVTDSTNKYAAERARDGAATGLLVVAEQQTSGRGRLDRRWESPAGAGLTLSLLLRPDVPADEWPWIGLMAAVAVADTLTAHGVARAAVKWPNDVLAGGHKIAGLLNERVETPSGPALILGIGLNIDQSAAELPLPTATSMRLATGSAHNRAGVLASLLAQLSQALQRAADPQARRTAYLQSCATIGQIVRVELPAEAPLTGEARGIDAQGRLLVATGGRVRPISAGDVVHVRPAR